MPIFLVLLLLVSHFAAGFRQKSYWPSSICAFNGRKMLLSVSTAKVTPTKTPFVYDADLWRKSYVDTKDEVCEVMDGDVPKDLVGTFYRNMHGQYTIGKDEVMHPFDADGMIAAFSFNNGSVLFRNRFVRTAGFQNERRRRRILYRGAFGTQIPGGVLANIFRTKLKNPANTNVIYYAKRLLALWESGNPYRLEEDSLRTIGKYTFKGVLQTDEPYTAHPKVDPKTGNLVGFSYNPTPEKTTLKITELNPDLDVVYQRSIDVPGFGLFHDMAVTENYYLFIQGSFDFDPLPFVLGQKAAAGCMKFKTDAKARLHLVPRGAQSSEARVIELDSHFNFHIANAFETIEGRVNIDVVGSQDMRVMTQSNPTEPIWRNFDWNSLPVTTLRRYTVDAQDKASSATAWRAETLYAHQFEMPVTNPAFLGQDVQYIYGISAPDKTRPGPFQSLVKVATRTPSEVQEYCFGVEEFVGEPAFAPRRTSDAGGMGRNQVTKEDDGYLLVMTMNSAEMASYLLIFDARDIVQGPLHRLRMPVTIAHGLHGNFVPDLTFDFNEVKRKFKAFSALDSKSWNDMEGGFSGLGISYDFQ